MCLGIYVLRSILGGIRHIKTCLLASAFCGNFCGRIEVYVGVAFVLKVCIVISYGVQTAQQETYKVLQLEQ